MLYGGRLLCCDVLVGAFWHCDMLYGGKLLCCDCVEASWYHDMLYGGILRCSDVAMVTCLTWKGRLLCCNVVAVACLPSYMLLWRYVAILWRYHESRLHAGIATFCMDVNCNLVMLFCCMKVC
jgi:hypothetical protein